jgi:Winged helix-turn helix
MPQASARPRRKRLSWESRCEVVATIEAGMSPPLAAASGGCGRATAYRLWRRDREGGWAALQGRPSRPRHQPRRLPAEVEERIVATRRRTAFRPVRLAGLVPSRRRRSGRCCAVTAARGCRGRAPPPAARADTSASAQASCCRSTRSNSAASGNRASVSSAPRRAARSETQDRMAAPARRDRRPLTTCRRRAPPRLRCRELRQLPGAGCRLVRRAGRRGRARADRQREGLPRASLAREGARARHRVPLHAHLPAPDKRKGRALHPDAAQRMGLCEQLSLKRRPHSSLAARPPISRVSHLRGQDS